MIVRSSRLQISSPFSAAAVPRTADLTGCVMGMGMGMICASLVYDGYKEDQYMTTHGVTRTSSSYYYYTTGTPYYKTAL